MEDLWKPKERVNFHKIFDISAKTNLNVDRLCIELRDLIDNLDDNKRSAKISDDNSNNISDADDDSADSKLKKVRLI